MALEKNQRLYQETVSPAIRIVDQEQCHIPSQFSLKGIGHDSLIYPWVLIYPVPGGGGLNFGFFFFGIPLHQAAPWTSPGSVQGADKNGH